MNLQELKTLHPKVFRASVEDGVKRERDRVVAHIDLGQKAGDLAVAIDAIKSGATMTTQIFRAYMASARNRQDVAARLEDDAVVMAAIENVARPPSNFGDPFEKAVTDRFVALVDTSAGGANIEDLEEA